MADSLSWVFRAHSEIGLVRKMNQDSGFVGRYLLMVADGMGGAAAGDLASAVAIDVIKHVDDRVDMGARHDSDGSDSVSDPDSDPDSGEAVTADADTAHDRNRELLANAIDRANARISDLVTADYELEGMGTTVTAGILEHDTLSLAHIGDSRAYLYRDRRLERLTHDHSWVQSLIDDGKISEDEAAVHPHRSLLLKVLNGQPANEPDLTRVPLRAGDRLLFCSDGLCGFVEDRDIAAELAGDDLDAVMDRLVADAHAAGGADNITIILVELVERPGGAGAAPAAVERAEGTGPVVLGAATEREIPGDDTMIRGRLRPIDDGTDGRLGDELADEDGSDGDDEDRYAPQLPDRRRVLRPLVGLLVLVLVLSAGVGAGFAWSRTQYYVGASGSQVAIYRGLAARPLGVSLSRVFEVQQLPVTALPPFYQEMVSSGIEVADLDGARATVSQLRQAAEDCARQAAGPAGSSTSTPTPKSSGKPTARTTGRTTVDPNASPTARAGSSSAGATTSSPVATVSPTATVSGALPQGGQRC